MAASFHLINTLVISALLLTLTSDCTLKRKNESAETPLPQISSWIFVDGTGSNGVNVDTTKGANHPSLVVLENTNDPSNSKLYITWSEFEATNFGVIRAKVFNGQQNSPGWSRVENTGVSQSGVDVYSASADGPYGYPQLTVFNSSLYAIWSEKPFGDPHAYIQIKVQQGSDSAPNWTAASPTTGINFVSTNQAFYPALATFQSKLYAIWSELRTSSTTHKIVAKKYESGTTWTSISPGVSGTEAINETANDAITSQLIVFQDKLYAIWAEQNGSNISQIHIKVYGGGTTWTQVEKEGAIPFTGLNYDSSQNAWNPQLAVLNNKLYATWVEDTSGSMKFQLRVKVYNGNDAAPSWKFVDGNTSTGLNVNSSKKATTPQLGVFQSNLYLIWAEDASTSGSYLGQIHMKVYNGNDDSSSWTLVDGTSSTGLNKDSSKSAELPQFTVFNNNAYNTIFATWNEGPAGSEQVNIAAAVFK